MSAGDVSVVVLLVVIWAVCLVVYFRWLYRGFE